MSLRHMLQYRNSDRFLPYLCTNKEIEIVYRRCPFYRWRNNKLIHWYASRGTARMVANKSAEGVEPKLMPARDMLKALAPYRKSSTARSIWELVITVVRSIYHIMDCRVESTFRWLLADLATYNSDRRLFGSFLFDPA